MFAASAHRIDWPRIEATFPRALTVVRLALLRSRQFLCALSGHEMVLRFEPERLSLHCLECGAATRGWTIEVKAIYRTRPSRGRVVSTTQPPVRQDQDVSAREAPRATSNASPLRGGA